MKKKINWERTLAMFGVMIMGFFLTNTMTGYMKLKEMSDILVIIDWLISFNISLFILPMIVDRVYENRDRLKKIEERMNEIER